MKTLQFLIPCLAVCVGCATKGPSFNPRAMAPFTPVALTNSIEADWLRAPTEPYRLGPGDVVEVELLGDPAPRATLNIGPDGKVYYSLLPGISLWGLTLAEAGELIKNEMGKYNKNMPDPSVTLRAVGSKRVWVLGASPIAGVYPLATPTTLLEALTAFGGIPASGGDDAFDLSRSFIMRSGKRLPVDFEKLLKRGDMTQNIYLQPEDYVFIRPASVANVYVMGAVRGPSALPYVKERTLATTIIAAGGTQKFAQVARVAIIRGSLSDPRIAEVNYTDIVTGRAPDVTLEPGDIVYVPFTPFRHLAQLAEDVIDQFARTIAVNEGIRAVESRSGPAGTSIGIGGAAATPAQ